MKVILASSVFERLSTAESAMFFWLGARGRHAIFVEDEGSPEYLRWRDHLSPEHGADWTSMLEACIREQATNPSLCEIRVERRAESSWRSLVLTVGDAVDLLQRPYRILVENGFSDRAFLLAFCGKDDREWLEDRIQREWVEVEHCGGIDHLGKRSKEIKLEPSRHVRTSALFDGDALRPGKPSAKNQNIADNCHPEIHHHMLRRRCIENYLPRVALEGWVRRSDGRQQKIRESCVHHLFELLSTEQRAHYNFKDGLDGDARRHDRAEDLFQNLSHEARRVLQTGLDPDIAALYRDRRVRWDDFDHMARQEIQPFLNELLSRIR